MKDQHEVLIKEVVEIIKAAKDLTIEQAPDVVQQILAYAFYSNLCGFLFGLLICGLSAHMIIKGNEQECTSDKGCYHFMGCVIASVGLIMLCVFITSLIKLHVAPKLYLIEYLKDFI